jgi:SAM-dependent methyltransferase
VSDSVRFDRAADFYDRTRAVDDAAMARTTELLSREVRDRGPVLEVGVGTGLLAMPLHATGANVHGLDLSAPMVGKLVEKAGGSVPFPIVLADATAMPFADGSFGAAYLRWVLHLIPDWRGVLSEIVRVVRANGVFVANLGSYHGPRREIQLRFGEITGITGAPVGLDWNDVEQLDREMSRLGASVRELPAIHEGNDETIRSFVDEIRDNLFSWTWKVPDEVRVRAADELEPWAEQRFGDLDEVRRWEYATVWRAYDLA